MRSGQSTPRGGVVRPTAIMATSPHQKGGRGFKHMPLALPEHGLGSPGGRFGAGVLDSPVLLPTFTAEPSPTTGTYPLGGSAFRGTAQGIQHLPTPKASEKKASALGRVSSARQAAANYASARSGAASYATASAHQQQQPHQPYHNPQTAARRRLQVLDDAQPSGSSSDDDDAIHVVQGARLAPSSLPNFLSRPEWRWGARFLGTRAVGWVVPDITTTLRDVHLGPRPGFAIPRRRAKRLLEPGIACAPAAGRARGHRQTHTTCVVLARSPVYCGARPNIRSSHSSLPLPTLGSPPCAGGRSVRWHPAIRDGASRQVWLRALPSMPPRPSRRGAMRDLGAPLRATQGSPPALYHKRRPRAQ